tara:strand:+ start:777 stop:926 length:150 start_codon:yes stop_codon:yes gene_type:complete
MRSEEVAQAVANRLVPLILFPYTKNRYGNGAIATVRKAKREVAHWSPKV